MYNTWVQAQAAAGHADIQAYSHTFRMLGSTEAVDARDNTATTGTGVPTYWLGGAKVADDYADFYDGSWDEEVAGRRETGATVTIGSSWEIWTGSAANGTEQINTDTTSRALGNAGNHWVGLGRPNSSTASHGPISGSTAARTGNKGVYALSYPGVFTVATPVVTPPVVTTGTEIWSATLTVGSRSFTPSITLLGWNDNGDYTGASLSDADFTFGGDTYEISMVQLVGTALTLGFATSHSGDIATKAIRDKLTLHVGSDSFNLGAGTLASNQHAITLTGASLSWSADESVALKITDDSTPVTTTAPTVTAVELTTTTTYAIGDEVEATVTFSAAVDITGTPRLELDFAGTAKPAACGAATNTTTMVCRYEVVADDSAPNGIAIAANKLTLNGGTIYATGSTTITADLAHTAVAIDAGHKVDGIRPTLTTTGTDAPTTSTDGTKVILTFSEDHRLGRSDQDHHHGRNNHPVNERGERDGNQGRTRPDDGPDSHDHEPHRGARRRRRRRRRRQRQPRRASGRRDQRRRHRHHHRPHGDRRRSHLHRHHHHLRHRRRGRGDGDLQRGGRHHRHPAARAGLCRHPETGRLRSRHEHDHDGVQLHGGGGRLGPERHRDRGEQAHAAARSRPPAARPSPPTSPTPRSRSTPGTRSTASARRSTPPATMRRRRRPTARR